MQNKTSEGTKESTEHMSRHYPEDNETQVHIITDQKHDEGRDRTKPKLNQKTHMAQLPWESQCKAGLWSFSNVINWSIESTDWNIII